MADRYLVGSGNWNNNANWSAISGGGGGASFPVAGDRAFLNSAFNIAVNVTSACAVLDMTGYSGTFSGAQRMNVSGNLTLGGTITYTGIMTMVGTSGTQVLTSNGKKLGGSFQLNGVGGTTQFADAFECAVTIQLVNGTLDTNNQQWKCRNFNMLAGTKSLLWTNSHGIFTGAQPTTSAWDTSTNAAGFSFTTGGASKATFTGAAGGSVSVLTAATTTIFDDVEYTGTGGLTFSANNGTYRDLICSGSGTISIGNGTWRNWDFTGCTGTWNQTAGNQVSGNITIGAGMTITGTVNVRMKGSGLQTFQSNGVTIPFLFRIGVSSINTVQLLDAFNSTNAVQIDVPGSTLVSKAGTTNTCTAFFSFGVPGTPCALASDTPGSPTTWNTDGIGTGSGTLKGGGEAGTVGGQLVVTDVHVGGGARWWAGNQAGNDNGGNAGWRFTDWNVRGLSRYVA
jgi:hypothetical protein